MLKNKSNAGSKARILSLQRMRQPRSGEHASLQVWSTYSAVCPDNQELSTVSTICVS